MDYDDVPAVLAIKQEPADRASLRFRALNSGSQCCSGVRAQV